MRKIAFTTLALSSLLATSACFFPEVPLEGRSCTSNSDCVSGYFCDDNEKCVGIGDAGIPVDASVDVIRPDVNVNRPDVEVNDPDVEVAPDVEVVPDVIAADVSVADVVIVDVASGDAG